MTTKQILFSAFMLCAIGKIGLAMDQEARTRQQNLNQELLRDALHGNADQVNEHLKNGAEVDATDEISKCTALHEAAWVAVVTEPKNEQYLTIISALIDNGANPNAKDKRDNTPAHNAAYNCNDTMLRRMHDKNFNLTIKNDDGKIPLDKALSSHSLLKDIKRHSTPTDKNSLYSYANDLIPHCETSIAFLEEIQKNQQRVEAKRKEDIEKFAQLIGKLNHEQQ